MTIYTCMCFSFGWFKQTFLILFIISAAAFLPDTLRTAPNIFFEKLTEISRIVPKPNLLGHDVYLVLLL